MKDIRQYFNYLYTLERSSMKYDLKNIRKLLNGFGNPHHKAKYIHIAGTNGKGAVASFIASIFKEHGIKTGLYTSPHILRFNERIRINGKEISNSYIKTFFDENKKLIEKVKPSFFEVSTAIALKYFSDKKADIAVIETGLGGRLDSTNIINPELIIITQIGIDHSDYLGNTLIAIAKEKMGIVKQGIEVIVSDTNKELRNLFIKRISKEYLYLQDKFVKTKIIKKRTNGTEFETDIRLNNKKYSFKSSSPLSGLYQVRNISTALLAMLIYFEDNKIALQTHKLQKALDNIKTNTGYRGRFEKVKLNGINYILDVSHNPSGIDAALSNFKQEKQPDVIVFAMMNDKDYKSAVRKLIKTGSKIIFTQPVYKRAVEAKILFETACELKISDLKKLYVKPKVKESVKLADKLAGRNGSVLIIGSFFLANEVIKALKIQSEFK